jgi:uncharacterized tellurite resistance protein B-like protein
MQNLKDWISRQLGLPTAKAGLEPAQGVNLAVAALLVEILRADYEVGAGERKAVVAAVGRLLGLTSAESESLVTNAELEIDKSHDLYQFTSQVNRSYSDADKLLLLEQLWRVAIADDVVHKYEEHLIRRVADLLHIPHSGFIAAKLRAGAGQAP